MSLKKDKVQPFWYYNAGDDFGDWPLGKAKNLTEAIKLAQEKLSRLYKVLILPERAKHGGYWCNNSITGEFLGGTQGKVLKLLNKNGYGRE